MKFNIKIPYHISLLFIHYFLGLLFFLIFRIIFFFTITSNSEIETKNISRIFKAFQIGLQFDSVVMGYILALPAITLLIIAVFFEKKEGIYQRINQYIFTLVFLAFFICSVDIPYFRYNSSRLSAIIFNWANNAGIVINMILEEKSYFVFIFVFILLFTTYLFIVKKILKKLKALASGTFDKKTIVLYSAVSLLLIFMAIRGRLDNPIKINHSFFCNNSFYNQLGLNPVFTLFKSLDNNRLLKILDDEVAINNIKKYLNLPASNNYTSAIARPVISGKDPSRLNVILVIMESMSAEKTGHFGNPNHLTPFLDSLAKVSYCFENVYSAGKHTYNGIFSTLYSYPAVLSEHLMSAMEIKKFSGFPGILKKEGYETIYFTTHSEIFDNVGVFLPANHFNKVFSQKNYDEKKIQSTFGIPDHELFDYAIHKIDKFNKTKPPFFATLMTVSDHAPFIIPKAIAFQPKAKKINEKIVEYADWSLKRFFISASKKEWFKNTVFIFVADHGGLVGKNTYEIPISYHHIPLLIYCADSSIVKPMQFNDFGCQIDIFPTVMGILNYSYVNNTLGIDLLKEKRKYSYFSADDKIGCIDAQFLYIYDNITGSEYLHKYKNGDPKNYIAEFPNEAGAMKLYAISMTQGAKWLITNNQTGLGFQ
jgi:phosphoglycerol transferase MdoB-like AlkP superfamily enzyme